MPVVNVSLLLDEKTYAGVKSGVLELCGMVKDSDHRIRKHLPTVFDAAKDGNLTVEILDELIIDLDNVAKYRKDDAIPLNLNAKQLTTLFNSIYDFTKRLAEANNICVDVKAPKMFKRSTSIDLRNYLDIQKTIIKKQLNIGDKNVEYTDDVYMSKQSNPNLLPIGRVRIFCIDQLLRRFQTSSCQMCFFVLS